MTGTLQDYFPTPIPLAIHYMGWGGDAGHGLPYFDYESDDPAVVKQHVATIKSWGISKIILDWYGDFAKFRQINRCAELLYRECFAQGIILRLSIDGGCLSSSANPTQDFIDLVSFVNTFWPASVGEIFDFGTETLATPIDWVKVIASYPGGISFIHRNAGGYTLPGAGAYAWLDGSGLAYLDNFYAKALTQPNKVTYGSLFWRFDDRLLGADGQPVVPNVNVWGKKKADGTPNITIIDPQNGQTFLSAVDKANAFIKAGGKMAGLVLNTFNDRQEGSNFDKGIKVTAGSPGLTVTAKPLFTL